MRVALTIALAALVLSLAPRSSIANDDPGRAVAIVEFRAGSAELPGIADAAATLLASKTSLAVLAQSEARKRYGAALDGDVVKCAGDAGCIADIGKSLEVKEVLLVGIGEFGDVILTLQRIDVDQGAVGARVAEALEPGFSPDQDAVEGYLRRVMPESDFDRFGVIRVVTNVDGAEVKVDRKTRGKTPLAPLKVPAPATYRVEVEKTGYTKFSVSIAVPPDAIIKVEPVLALRADQVWYKKWWVIAIAGAVVTSAAVTTAVIVTRDQPDDVGVVIEPF